MSMIVPSKRGTFRIGGQAFLLGEGSDKLQAWAERFVRKDPDLKFLLGNYVEANKANLNGHIFPLEDLAPAVGSIKDKPLNMLHREQHVLGTFVGAQLLTPEGAEITAEDVATIPTEMDPFVEALSALWYRRFPEEFFDIRRAHADGSLYYSMEAIPAEVSCPDCELRAVFDGLESDTYCAHMQGPTGPKRLHQPNFCGGAIVIPPAKPGWSRADMKTISTLLAEHEDEAAGLYASLEADMPHLGVAAWEGMMTELLLQKETSPKT